MAIKDAILFLMALANKKSETSQDTLTRHSSIGEEVIRGCVAFERKSQEELYRFYFKMACCQCMKYTNDQDSIMTIVNDAFMKIFEKIHQYDYKGSFDGWLKRVVFTTLADYFRKQKIKVSFLEVPETVSEFVPVLEKMYFEDLMETINRLPELTRKVFTFYHIEGYNHKEIAEQMGFSEGNSKWHLHQAKKLLQELAKSQN